MELPMIRARLNPRVRLFVLYIGCVMLLPILEFVLAGLVVWIAISQIILPILRGTPLFSAIQRQGIEAKLESAKHELRIAELEREIAGIRRREQAVRMESLEDELGRFTENTLDEKLAKGKHDVVSRRSERE